MKVSEEEGAMDAVEIKESRTDVALLVAMLICIASSSSIAHEYASRFLDVAIAFGTAFNIRAFSCAAHAIGLAVGFGAAAFLGQTNISRLRGMRALTAFFLSQISLPPSSTRHSHSTPSSPSSRSKSP